MEKNKYLNKISENIKVLFLIFFIFSLGMLFYKNFPEIKIQEIKFLFIFGTIFIGYFLVKIILPKIFSFFKKIYNSKRYDILASIIFGALFFIYNFTGLYQIKSGELLKEIKNLIYKINHNFDYINCLLIIFIFGTIFIGYFLVKIILPKIFSFLKIYNKKENKIKGLLISDKPISKEEDDKLGMNNRAKDFSQTIWNNGSTDTHIFGLIAPWGHGKTSFLKLFEEELKEKYKDKYEIFKFNPWYFESEKSLLEKFLNGISSQLSSKYFLPKLDGDLKDLVKFLQDKGNGFLGTNFNFSKTESLEDIKNNINNSLKELDKKLIIIIDDLDRFTSEKLKVIFKILDLCKGFHNTSYILCYDPNNFNNIENELKETRTQNIGNNNDLSISTENIDNTNLVKYIAKIINIQYPIYPDYEKLKQYFKDLFINDIGLEFSENSKKGIENGIEELYILENFGVWGDYISDIRSMKRIANNFLAIQNIATKVKNETGKIYFQNLFENIHFSDFIKLSILSINKNYLYLDISNNITLKNDFAQSIFKNKFSSLRENDENMNSTWIKYLSSLNNNDKLFIINIFGNGNKVNEINNLKEINNIINGNSEHVIYDIDFEVFIKNKIEEYKDNKNELLKIFEEINNKYGEEGIRKFINYFKENVFDLSNKEEKIYKFIDYILDNFYIYSFELNNLIGYDIKKLLDISVSDNNTDENCRKIGDYFYENGKVIEKLFNEKWGVIGLYIILTIRLGLDRTRNNSLFNFESGMVDGYDENKQNERNKNFYLAKISRSIYNKFKEVYINGGKNIFEEMFVLLEKNITVKKEGIITFIIYQLTFEIGYFDNSENINDWENQNWGIKKELQDYFFNKCFDGEKGLKYFLRYISEFLYVDMERNIIYNKNDLLNVLKKDKLSSFIEENKYNIESLVNNYKNDILIEKYNNYKFVVKKTYQEFWEIFKEEFGLK